jgi:multicomponent Na+:H+ antiporter subunit B
VTSRDSLLVTVTVRAVTPFVLTFGAFTTLHGTTSVGGGFQGGVVAAAALVTVGFAFGVDQTRRALGPTHLLAGAVGGSLLIAAVALGSLALGGAFLDAGAYGVLPVAKAPVYAVELVEVGIGFTVAAVLGVLFLELGGETR